jgi:hypothetical protein
MDKVLINMKIDKYYFVVLIKFNLKTFFDNFRLNNNYIFNISIQR